MHASHDNVTVSHFVAARDIRTLSSLSNIKIQFLMASLVTLIDVCKTSITIMGKLLPGNPKDCLPTKYWCHSFIMKLYFQSGSFSWKPFSTIIENWIIQAFFNLWITNMFIQCVTFILNTTQFNHMTLLREIADLFHVSWQNEQLGQ